MSMAERLMTGCADRDHFLPPSAADEGRKLAGQAVGGRVPGVQGCWGPSPMRWIWSRCCRRKHAAYCTQPRDSGGAEAKPLPDHSAGAGIDMRVCRRVFTFIGDLRGERRTLSREIITRSRDPMRFARDGLRGIVIGLQAAPSS